MTRVVKTLDLDTQYLIAVYMMENAVTVVPRARYRRCTKYRRTLKTRPVPMFRGMC